MMVLTSLAPDLLSDAIATNRAHFGRQEGPIFLDEIDCLGNETNILECLSVDARDHNCLHWKDAGVICPRMFRE